MTIMEVRGRLLTGKGNPNLEEIDIYDICGVLTSFIRSLGEPLVTFRLHPVFVEAAGTYINT